MKLGEGVAELELERNNCVKEPMLGERETEKCGVQERREDRSAGRGAGESQHIVFGEVS